MDNEVITIRISEVQDILNYAKANCHDANSWLQGKIANLTDYSDIPEQWIPIALNTTLEMVRDNAPGHYCERLVQRRYGLVHEGAQISN